MGAKQPKIVRKGTSYREFQARFRDSSAGLDHIFGSRFDAISPCSKCGSCSPTAARLAAPGFCAALRSVRPISEHLLVLEFSDLQADWCKTAAWIRDLPTMKTALKHVIGSSDCEQVAISSLLTVAIEALDAAGCHVAAAHAEMALATFHRSNQCPADNPFWSISSYE